MTVERARSGSATPHGGNQVRPSALPADPRAASRRSLRLPGADGIQALRPRSQKCTRRTCASMAPGAPWTGGTGTNTRAYCLTMNNMHRAGYLPHSAA
ncbi:hypothetical protein GCM10017688_63130 [Streptomyces ramulosus]